MIYRVEKEKAKEIAQAVLEAAKQAEARKLASGAKYQRIDSRTIILTNDSSKSKKRK